MSIRSLDFGILCVFALAAASVPSMGNPVDDGERLAVEACSACHQVVPRQKRPPPVSEGDEGTKTQAPTFMEIANRCLSAGDLKKKIANPHYPMREQLLIPVDLDDLAVYIQSLSARADCAIR